MGCSMKRSFSWSFSRRAPEVSCSGCRAPPDKTLATSSPQTSRLTRILACEWSAAVLQKVTTLLVNT